MSFGLCNLIRTIQIELLRYDEIRRGHGIVEGATCTVPILFWRRARIFLTGLVVSTYTEHAEL